MEREIKGDEEDRGRLKAGCYMNTLADVICLPAFHGRGEIWNEKNKRQYKHLVKKKLEAQLGGFGVDHKHLIRIRQSLNQKKLGTKKIIKKNDRRALSAHSLTMAQQIERRSVPVAPSSKQYSRSRCKESI